MIQALPSACRCWAHQHLLMRSVQKLKADVLVGRDRRAPCPPHFRALACVVGMFSLSLVFSKVAGASDQDCSYEAGLEADGGGAKCQWWHGLVFASCGRAAFCGKEVSGKVVMYRIVQAEKTSTCSVLLPSLHRKSSQFPCIRFFGRSGTLVLVVLTTD